jgi:hypothetical protein
MVDSLEINLVEMDRRREVRYRKPVYPLGFLRLDTDAFQLGRLLMVCILASRSILAELA